MSIMDAALRAAAAECDAKDKRISELEGALRELLVNIELGGHLGLHKNHPSVLRARKHVPMTPPNGRRKA